METLGLGQNHQNFVGQVRPLTNLPGEIWSHFKMMHHYINDVGCIEQNMIYTLLQMSCPCIKHDRCIESLIFRTTCLIKWTNEPIVGIEQEEHLSRRGNLVIGWSTIGTSWSWYKCTPKMSQRSKLLSNHATTYQNWLESAINSIPLCLNEMVYKITLPIAVLITVYQHLHCKVEVTVSMGLLPDTQNRWLRMRRECRERFPRHRLQRKPLVSDPGLYHGTCVTHVPWCMSGSLNRGKGIPGACATRTQFYVSGKRPILSPKAIYDKCIPSNHCLFDNFRFIGIIFARDFLLFPYHRINGHKT